MASRPASVIASSSRDARNSPAERVRRFPFVAAPDQQPRQRERRRRIRVAGDGGAVGRDRQVVGARARLQVADARQRLRIGARGGRRRVRQRARDVVTRERDVGDLQVGLARARRREARELVEPRHRLVELAGALEQVDEREPGLDGDVARDAASASPALTRASSSLSVAIAPRESPVRCCASARNSATSRSSGWARASSRSWRICASMRPRPWRTSSPSSRTRASRRSAACCSLPGSLRSASASTVFHSVTASFDLPLVLEDLGQQAVGIDALRFERLRPLRLGDRVGGEVVLQQHLGQPQVAAHRRPHALAQRRPGRARFVLLADLELRLAQADDDDLVARDRACAAAARS